MSQLVIEIRNPHNESSTNLGVYGF